MDTVRCPTYEGQELAGSAFIPFILLLRAALILP